MAERSRRRVKTIYERIDDINKEIIATEEKLSQLKLQLNNLHAEKDNFEMHQLFDLIKNNGISFEQAKSILIK